ncbi:Uncharacterized protein FWK35_00020887, partial [Aphis craccivora]
RTHTHTHTHVNIYTRSHALTHTHTRTHDRRGARCDRDSERGTSTVNRRGRRRRHRRRRRRSVQCSTRYGRGQFVVTCVHVCVRRVRACICIYNIISLFYSSPPPRVCVSIVPYRIAFVCARNVYVVICRNFFFVVNYIRVAIFLSIFSDFVFLFFFLSPIPSSACACPVFVSPVCRDGFYFVAVSTRG